MSATPQTSLDAFDYIEPISAEIEALIYRHLFEQPMNCWELECATGLSHQTVSGRLTKMRGDGRIVMTDERRPSEKLEGFVWAIAPPGTKPVFKPTRRQLEAANDKMLDVMKRLIAEGYMSLGIYDDIKCIIAEAEPAT